MHQWVRLRPGASLLARTRTGPGGLLLAREAFLLSRTVARQRDAQHRGGQRKRTHTLRGVPGR